MSNQKGVMTIKLLEKKGNIMMVSLMTVGEFYSEADEIQ